MCLGALANPALAWSHLSVAGLSLEPKVMVPNLLGALVGNGAASDSLAGCLLHGRELD